MSNTIKIVDCNMHLWDTEDQNDATHTWLMQEDPGTTQVFRADYFNQLSKKYTVKEYLQDCEGFNVIKSIKLDCNTTDAIKEARYAQALADKYGHPHGIVAAADPLAPDFEQTLEILNEIPNVRALRKYIYRKPQASEQAWGGDVIIDENFCKQFGKTKKYPKFKWELACSFHALPDVLSLIRKFPDVSMALGGFGAPRDSTEEGHKLWKENLVEFAKCSNVMLKLTAVGFYFGNKWTIDFLRPWVLDAIEIFGPERCMFGSGLPFENLYGSSFAKLYNAFFEIVSDMTEKEQNLLFSENAIRWYGL